MLKRKAMRKIIITTFSILTIFVICIIPNKLNTNDNFLNPKIDTLYVTNVGTSEIYFLGPNNYLIKTNVILNEKDSINKIKSIIEYLTIDKSNKVPAGLSGIIPKNTKLNDVEINDKIVTLNFSKELLDVSKDLEEREIEAITYSIINIDGIEGVIIKIDGCILKQLPQTKKILPDILNRNFGINKVFEYDNVHNVEKVVLYYINKIGNNSYYVPVTKYLNDDREKIKIIIENLSSNYIYEPSLVSLVNQNTKLINYDITDKTMNLNFNSSIFTNDKILEEVAYPISMSVFENYDIDKIVFEMNGQEIATMEK